MGLHDAQWISAMSALAAVIVMLWGALVTVIHAFWRAIKNRVGELEQARDKFETRLRSSEIRLETCEQDRKLLWSALRQSFPTPGRDPLQDTAEFQKQFRRPDEPPPDDPSATMR